MLKYRVTSSEGAVTGGDSSSTQAVSPAQQQQQRPATVLGIALNRGRRASTPGTPRSSLVPTLVPTPENAAVNSSSNGSYADTHSSSSGGAVGVLHLSMPGDENDASAASASGAAAEIGAAMKRTRSRRSSMIPR